MSELNCWAVVGRMSNPTSRPLSACRNADGHVYNQKSGWLHAWYKRLHELIGKVRSEWLQAAHSISNPNGRCGATDRAEGRRREGRREETRMTTAGNGQRLHSAAKTHLYCRVWMLIAFKNQLLADATPASYRRCQFSPGRDHVSVVTCAPRHIVSISDLICCTAHQYYYIFIFICQESSSNTHKIKQTNKR